LFTTEGKFMRSFGSSGKRPGEFRHPRGLAVDGSGVVYVCDYDNNRVTVF
jgi:DNA-binding beta-propeller fold protein YncE